MAMVFHNNIFRFRFDEVYRPDGNSDYDKYDNRRIEMFIKAGNKIVNIDRCESLEFRRSCRNVDRKNWKLIVEIYTDDRLLTSVVIADLRVDVDKIEFGAEWNDDSMYIGKVWLNGCESSGKKVSGMSRDNKEDLWTFFEEDTSRSESCFIEYVWNCIRDNIDVDLINYECIGGQQ